MLHQTVDDVKQYRRSDIISLTGASFCFSHFCRGFDVNRRILICAIYAHVCYTHGIYSVIILYLIRRFFGDSNPNCRTSYQTQMDSF